MDDWSIRLRRAVAQQLASLQAAGLGQVSQCDPETTMQPEMSPRPPKQAGSEPPAAATTAETTPSGPPERQTSASEMSPRQQEAKSVGRAMMEVQSLEVLQEQVAACTRCDALACSRTQTVFGIGNTSPELCFFGEAPGQEEDQQGEPFVGPAGQLLNDIIEKGMGLKRSDVYILNVLKCRPPGNRNPQPDEIENCRPFYLRQLELLRPKFICCLGAFAAKTLLDTEQGVGRLRGCLHPFSAGELQAQVVVTYHPAYLLRNPEEKGKAWDDIKLLMLEMGLKQT